MPDDTTGDSLELADLVRAAMEGERLDPGEVAGGAGRYVVERDPAPGVAMRAVPADVPDPPRTRCTVFAPGRERPEAYPPELPFLPDRRVTVFERTDPGAAPLVLAQWIGTGEPGSVMEALLERSRAEGWERAEAPLPVVVLRKDEFGRYLIPVSGEEREAVTLVQGPGVPDLS